MKLATLKNQTRDGQLHVVSRDLKSCVSAHSIVPTLQAAVDDWENYFPQLNHLSDKLNDGKLATAKPFLIKNCHAPLPRAYQWADGSAYVHHVELVRKARGVVMPENFWHEPLMYQGGSDDLLGPTDPIVVREENYGIDFEAEVAVITKDVPMAANEVQAEDAILLCLLVNDVSLRELIPGELAKGFGFFQSKPASAFSPVAVTLDELGAAWHEGKVHLPLYSYLNEKLFGKPNAGVDMTFNFPTLIKHAAKTRFLKGGSIIGSGTVSNRDVTTGSSCIIEKRMLELIQDQEITTPFLKFGDRIKIEMNNLEGQSIFGAIDQIVMSYTIS